MSMLRPVWNDGQGLTTPDLQRPCDVIGGADDRVYEVLLTPNAVQKTCIPLLLESATVNPRLLAIPSSAGLTPAGVNGAVRVQPFTFMAGSASSGQQVSLCGTMYAALDTSALASNSSGANRYDLVYATLTRQVTVTASRRIKSAVDGSVSSQTVNLADAPTISISVVSGFVTGATPPTAGQIASALPADTTTSFSVAICYVTVANGYSSGTTLAQSALTPTWSRGYVVADRVQQVKIASLTSTAGSSPNPIVAVSTRLNPNQRMLIIWRTANTASNYALTLDNSIDWRYRLIRVQAMRTAGGKHPANQANMDTHSAFTSGSLVSYDSGWWASGAGLAYSGSSNISLNCLNVEPGANPSGVGSQIAHFVDNAAFSLRVAVTNTYTPVDGTNGDHWTFIVEYSDQFLNAY